MRLWLFTGLCVLMAAPAPGDDQLDEGSGEDPGSELLEFLGSWGDDDDTWQAMIDSAAAQGDERRARRDDTEPGDE